MFRTVNDFLQSWQIEADTTKRLFGALTNDSLAFGNEHFPRGVGRLSQHLVEAIPAFFATMGTPLVDTEFGKTATSTSDLIGEYDSMVNAASAVASKWTDASMTEMVPFFGGREMPRGAALAATIGHQTHHRGQLTVLMREAGLPGVNVYGPTKEDWIKMGKEPQV